MTPQPVTIRSLGYSDLPQVISIERRAFPTPWSLAMFVLELSKPSGVCLAAIEDRPNRRLSDLRALRRRLASDEHRRRPAAPAARDRHRAARGDDRARRTRTRRTRSRCVPSNAHAIALYERFGFRSAGTRRATTGHRRGRADHVAHGGDGVDARARPGDPRARDELRRHLRGGRHAATGEIRSNVISSQGVHDRYGGVVPEIASRHHLELIGDVVDDALARAGVVARRPRPRRGHARARAGRGAARRRGHRQGTGRGARAAAGAGRPPPRPRRRRRSSGPTPFEPPFLSLIASGGHTLLARVTDHGPGLRGARPDARRRRRRGVRQGRAAAGPRLSGRRRRSSGSRATAIPEAFRVPRPARGCAGPRLLVRRSEDRAAVPGPRPRRGRGRAPPGRPRRLLSAGDRRVAGDPRRAGAGARPGSSGSSVGGGVAANGAAARAHARARASSCTCPPRELCTDNAAMIASAARFVERAAVSRSTSTSTCTRPASGRWSAR